MKKRFHLFTFFLFLFLFWLLPSIPAQAAKNELTITEHDLTDGIYLVPAGTYQTITVDKSVLNATIYLRNVTVNESIFVYSNGAATPEFLLADDTYIENFILFGNATILSFDTDERIKTISVRHTAVIHLKASCHHFSVTKGSTNVQTNLYRNITLFTDRGTNNIHYLYADIDYLRLEGSYLYARILNHAAKSFLIGSGNKLSIMGKADAIGVYGDYSVVSVDSMDAVVNVLLQSTKDAYLIRSDRISQIKYSENVSSTVRTFPISCDSLFIGDSFTEFLYRYGYFTSSIEGLFAGGSAPKHWFKKGEKALDYADRLSEYAPKKIVYLYGINQIKQASNIEYSKQLLSLLLEQFPEIPIYVQRVFPVSDNYIGLDGFPYDYYNFVGQYNVESFNKSLEAFCKTDKRLIWVDTTKGLLDGNSNLMRSKTADYLHLNEEACKEWWNNIKKSIFKDLTG